MGAKFLRSCASSMCLPSGFRGQLTHLMEQECLYLLQVATAVELTDPANSAQLLAQLQNAVRNIFDQHFQQIPIIYQNIIQSLLGKTYLILIRKAKQKYYFSLPIKIKLTKKFVGM